MNENQKTNKARDDGLVEKTTLVSRKGATVTVQRLTLSKRGTRVLTSSSRGIRSGSTDGTQHRREEEMACS